MSLTRAQLLRRGAAFGVTLLLPLPDLSAVQADPFSLTLSPGGGGLFMASDCIRNEFTGEIMRVCAIHGDTLTVERVGRQTPWL